MSTKIKITEEQLKRIIQLKNIQEQQAGFGFAKEANEEDEKEESTHESIEKIADLYCELFADKSKDADYIEGIFSLAKSVILNGKSEEKEDEEDDDEENEVSVMGGEEKEDEEEEDEDEEDEDEKENNNMNESVQKIKANFKRFL
jgi:hypothetical protein